jgi:hypothetical protein
MSSFQYRDTCYPSETAALEAFAGQFDNYIGATTGSTMPVNVWSLTTANVNSTGLITYSLRSPLGISPQSFQLQPCDSKSSNSVFDKMPVQDMLFAAFFILIFVIGFGQGRGAK